KGWGPRIIADPQITVQVVKKTIIEKCHIPRPHLKLYECELAKSLPILFVLLTRDLVACENVVQRPCLAECACGKRIDVANGEGDELPVQLLVVTVTVRHLIDLAIREDVTCEFCERRLAETPVR